MAIDFTSTREKDAYKDEVRQARQEVLDKAKRQYEKAKWREEQAERRGENTWMLASVNARIESDEKELKKRSKHKKKEKKKKHKKEKKSKHRKKSSDSDSESGDEPNWVERSTDPKPEKAENEDLVKRIGPKIEREDWMSAPLDFLPTISRNDIREQKKKEQEEEKKKLILEAGQHQLELNPFWKDGGTGLPEENKEAKPAPLNHRYWKKAYDRCVQQAEEEGRTLEEIATGRYGSLRILKENLENSSQSASSNTDRTRYDRSSRDSHDRNSRHDRDRDRADHRKSYRDDDRRDRKHERSDDRDRNDRRPIDTDRESSSRSKFRRPGDSHTEEPSRRKFSFMKPGESSDARSSSSRPSSSSSQGWRKKTAEPTLSERRPEKPDLSRRDRTPPRSQERRDPVPAPRSRSPSVSSASDSESDSSESDEEAAQTVPILTEQEKNEIGAKIVKAEIMGNDSLAKQLKDRLDASRKAESQKGKVAAKSKESKGKKGKSKNKGGDDEDDDNEVVLSITDRSGMSRPLPERKHPSEPKGGRRKKQKVETHADGERERYFDDDDKYDLKALVEREKMGTTEDSNMMFARLAGRTFEKTDDDHQIDDVFIQRANKKQSESRQEEKDRGVAIHEHKKKTSAMEKCKHCFDNVAKHLIVSLGTKVYISLPNHKSITEGHCFIVPMQHVSQSTVVDEDVWDEIQAFRRCLTRMFEAQDEDCVFMETSMTLNKFPHMAIECVPMPREVGDMAPIYFKKALMESENEWSQNKKVVELSQKNIKQAIPKGFPYFAVDFGLQGGFAHVIEEEQTFPWYFGREICGGMMDIEPTLWRKPHKDSFEAQRQKVLQFEKMWKPFDWTLNIQSSI